MYSDPSALRDAALLLKNLERLSATIEPLVGHCPDLTADDAKMVATVQLFNPLKCLCIQAIRSVSALRDII